MASTSELNRRAFLTAGAAALAGAHAFAALPQAAPVAKPTREIFDNVDVLVCGGGPAGIGAAIAAARHGAKTLLIENHAFFGGVAIYGMGMPMNQMRPGGKPRSDVHELLISKLLKRGDRAVRIGPHQLWCNVDYLKVAAFDALEAAGCRYLVHVRAVDSIVEGNRIVGVVAATKEGLVTIRAKAVVDCTGDADVAYFAGAETMKETGALSPMTLCFDITNIDMDAARKVNMGEVSKKARAKYPLIPNSWGLDRYTSKCSYYINHSGTRQHGEFDGADPESMTRAEALSRRQVVQMVEAMREYGGPAFEKVELSGTGPQVGVRETRRVKGLYALTEDDALQGRQFDDAIAWRSGFLDIGFVRLTEMKIHDVPYRAILPANLDGLLMAGRCISATHVGAAAGKSMGNCMATGHAAGLSATLSAKKGCVPRELNVSEIQEALRADRVDLARGGQDQKGLVSEG